MTVPPNFVPFPRQDIERSVVWRFEQQVARVPDRLAIQAGDQALSYAELNARANVVAHALLAGREGPPAPVALLMHDPVELVASMIGVLKAGDFYVVLGSRDPVGRQRALLEDADPAALLHDAAADELVAEASHALPPRLDVAALRVTDGARGNPPRSSGPDSLLNIMYTSGSTGRPKGVLQTHRNLLHCVYTTHNRLRHTEDDRMALLSPPTVGVSAAMLFAGLLIGASVFPFDVRRHGVRRMVEWLERERLTSSYSLPSVIRGGLSLLEPDHRLADLRTVKLGGEPMTRGDVALFRQHLPPRCRVQITLGTTETYAITWWHVDLGREPATPVLPVGYAEEDTTVTLRDENGTAVEPGTPGEIFAASRYFSPGYWRQPEVTRAVYSQDDEGVPVYRTGDLGVILDDGNLLHLGRADAVIKTRGHLVSPIEVETVLREVDWVLDAAVVGVDQPGGGKSLAAYIVPERDHVLDLSALRAAVGQRLPDYMLPSIVVRMPQLPRLPGGKIDVRALPRPDQAGLARERPFVAPRTPIEQVLADIWCQVLGRSQVSVHDEFSLLGGDSLAAARVLAAASKACGVDLTYEVLFEARTVEMLAQSVTRQLATALDAGELADLLGEVEALANGDVVAEPTQASPSA